jgi:hypothetical protein
MKVETVESLQERLLKKAIVDAEWQIKVRRKLIRQWKAELKAMSS